MMLNEETRLVIIPNSDYRFPAVGKRQLESRNLTWELNLEDEDLP